MAIQFPIAQAKVVLVAGIVETETAALIRHRVRERPLLANVVFRQHVVAHQPPRLAACGHVADELQFEVRRLHRDVAFDIRESPINGTQEMVASLFGVSERIEPLAVFPKVRQAADVVSARPEHLAANEDGTRHSAHRGQTLWGRPFVSLPAAALRKQSVWSRCASRVSGPGAQAECLVPVRRPHSASRVSGPGVLFALGKAAPTTQEGPAGCERTGDQQQYAGGGLRHDVQLHVGTDSHC